MLANMIVSPVLTINNMLKNGFIISVYLLNFYDHFNLLY